MMYKSCHGRTSGLNFSGGYKMKKFAALILALAMVLALAACGSSGTAASSSAAAGSSAAAASGSASSGKVYNVCYLVNGNLGDKSFFDSAEAGLEQLQSDGRITLYEVSDAAEYDLIVCGTYQMPDYLKEVATKYPDQKYLIFDDNTYVGANSNVVNVTFKQNDLGYLVGVFAACMTEDTAVANINADKVVGFVGGVDSPVINDFLYGFILGAQSVDPDIKIDTRYTNDYVDTAIANAGNGAAEAALESGKCYFIGVDSDQELTLSSDLAAITLTSGLKNIGNALIWFFDQWDAGTTYWGKEVNLGIAEGGVGIVTDKNYAKIPSDATRKAVSDAQDAILNGTITVPSALGNDSGDVEKLREAVRPS